VRGSSRVSLTCAPAAGGRPFRTGALRRGCRDRDPPVRPVQMQASLCTVAVPCLAILSTASDMRLPHAAPLHAPLTRTLPLLTLPCYIISHWLVHARRGPCRMVHGTLMRALAVRRDTAAAPLMLSPRRSDSLIHSFAATAGRASATHTRARSPSPRRPRPCCLPFPPPGRTTHTADHTATRTRACPGARTARRRTAPAYGSTRVAYGSTRVAYGST
jgi:hypothetical protein